jgi:acyl-CoA synthetase (AMP-forming)/AMP-acid ligase II
MSGFDSTAFCPAYGLAEATLAVTMTEPDDHWTELTVDADSLMSGAVVPTSVDGVRLVSCGAPLDGMEVTVSPSGGLGPISVAGPSVFDGYLGGDPSNGRVTTDDQGFLYEGQLYVTGRTDDVLVVRGRNLLAADLEDAVERLREVRSGSCVVVNEPPGYSVVLEPATTPAAARVIAGLVRRALIDQCGIAPRRTLIVQTDTVPTTSSGKKQRRQVERRLRSGELEVLHEATTSPRAGTGTFR